MGEKKLANFIIAGVNKAGSTSLFHYLSEHPEICGSRDKETCYFLPLLYGKQPAPISEYEAQFASCRFSKYRMEATPAYIFGKDRIAKTIKETLGPVKILIILKDPVDRLISFYKRKKATLQLENGITFKEYVHRCLAKTPEELECIDNQLYTGIALGYYDEFIEPWLKIYGKDIKVVFFDDLVKDPERFMTGICNWLEIDPGFYRDYAFSVKNRSLQFRSAPIQKLAVKANTAGKLLWRKNPGLKEKLLSFYYRFNGKPFERDEIDSSVTQFLREHFEPHNRRLHSILSSYGVDGLPQWLGSPEPVAA